jgi:hypothetical protein
MFTKLKAVDKSHSANPSSQRNNSGVLHHALGCLLITVKLHSRIRDNSCAVGAIAFEKTGEALTLPN